MDINFSMHDASESELPYKEIFSLWINITKRARMKFVVVIFCSKKVLVLFIDKLSPIVLLITIALNNMWDNWFEWILFRRES